MEASLRVADARSMLMKRNFSVLLASAGLCIPGKEGRLWGGEAETKRRDCTPMYRADFHKFTAGEAAGGAGSPRRRAYFFVWK